MISDQEFLALTSRAEDETLDFKSESYDLSSDDAKYAFIKDVICMANTPRSANSFIILGVKKHPNGKADLNGITKHLDDADLQAQFTDRIHPIPRFGYEVLTYQGKEFGLVIIPPERSGPYVPLKERGGLLRQYQVYFRRGSRNDVATPEDLRRIIGWINAPVGPAEPNPASVTPAWDRFMDAVHGFESTRRYVLFSNVPSPVTDPGDSIGLADWCFVADFDPNTEAHGLLKAVRSRIETRRTLHLVIGSDRPTLHLDRGTYWFFARGLTASKWEPEVGPWKAWHRRYGNEMREQIMRLAKASIPTPVTIVAVWYQDTLNEHLQSAFEAALAAFGSTVDFVILTADPANLHPVAAKFDAALVEMPLHHFASGLATVLSNRSALDSEECFLPSSSGTPVPIGTKERNWIEEEMELVHLGVGSSPSKGESIGMEFLTGNEISWYDLGLHYDVERDRSIKLEEIIRSDLKGRRCTRVNLFHNPGAGGTTVGRRIAWNLHTLYPCAILRQTKASETADRLQHLVALTGQPLLLIAEGSDIAEADLDEIFQYSSARHLPVVMLQVLRRFSVQTRRERSVVISGELSDGECTRFVEVLSRAAPGRRSDLSKLATQEPKRLRTPFHFCLKAFGKDFLGIEPYVQVRLQSLNDEQRRIICFLAIAHHYGQKALPAQVFADLLGIPASKNLVLDKVIPEHGLDLLVEVKAATWRTVHDLIAVEILKQLLSASPTNKESWRQSLSSWAIEFINLCRGASSSVPSEETLDVVRRTFVYRDNLELLGTEQAGSRKFGELIGDIPVKEGQLTVLRTLIEIYPEEAHFWAHLGRFYSLEMKDYSQAIGAVDHAIELQPTDSVLYHMKGMIMRNQVYEYIHDKKELGVAVSVAQEASSLFGKARELNPNEEHGYISEVQMISRVLDYAGTLDREGLIGYLASPSADPFLRVSFQQAEDLLEQVRRNREGETASPYEQECRARLDALYGRHDRALQIWDSLLTRGEVYAPDIRRQIVWTYLARKQRSWDALSPKELERTATLLEQNLKEEPNNERNLRLWIQAVRRQSSPPSLESVIEKVAYWKANTGSVDATYYLYVLYAIQAFEGSALGREAAARHIEECRNKARLRRNRTKSFEWIGKGNGLAKIVHQSRLGEWDRNTEFFSNTTPLARVTGRIARIDGPEAGYIETSAGLSAFFVPARGNFSRGRSENQPVNCYLGFSYDGLRAWDVMPEN